LVHLFCDLFLPSGHFHCNCFLLSYCCRFILRVTNQFVSMQLNLCSGYCHNSCTTSSTVLTNEDFEFIITCKQCSHGKATQTNSNVESPTSPLAMQGQEYRNSTAVTKSVKLRSTTQHYQNTAVVAKSLRTKSNNQPSPSVGAVEAVSDKKPVSSDPNSKRSLKKDRQCHWGLIWKKKKTDDGSDFRLKNVLFGGNPSVGSTLRPSCYLCHKPYNHDLMYIHCETCQSKLVRFCHSFGHPLQVVYVYMTSSGINYVGLLHVQTGTMLMLFSLMNRSSRILSGLNVAVVAE